MKATCETRFRTAQYNAATGELVCRSEWQKNLFLDAGINAFANKAGGIGAMAPAEFSRCMAGSGTNANSFASGAITFTQVGNTLTASSAFFTAAMVNAVFKYGTGGSGVELYITAFTSSTIVTVSGALTVATPTVGTVWMVQQTALQTQVMFTDTFDTTAGNCQTTFATNTVTHQKVFKFAVQGGTVNINEVGWGQGNSSTLLGGRAVLGSTDVVPVTNFYVVQLQIIITYTPSVPTAVGNVGTNINTAGNLAIESFKGGTCRVNADGSSTSRGAAALDGAGNSIAFGFYTASIVQNASPANGTTNGPDVSTGVIQLISNGQWVFTGTGTAPGTCTLTSTASITTSGQSMKGCCLNTNFAVADVQFTTPQTAPTGTFQPNTVWQMTFGRNLVN